MADSSRELDRPLLFFIFFFLLFHLIPLEFDVYEREKRIEREEEREGGRAESGRRRMENQTGVRCVIYCTIFCKGTYIHVLRMKTMNNSWHMEKKLSY